MRVGKLSLILMMAGMGSVVFSGCCNQCKDNSKNETGSAAVLSSYSTEDNVKATEASPSFKEERMAEAMRGLVYDSGLVELDADYVNQIADFGDRQAAELEFELGMEMLYEVNDRTAAIAAFTRAVLCIQDNPDYYVGLGMALSYKGKSDKALAAFRSALMLNPDHFAAQYKMAYELQKLGQFTEAALGWQRVLEMEPENGEVHTQLALVYYYSGDYARSWKHVHAAEAFGSDVPPQFRPLLAAKMSEN